MKSNRYVFLDGIRGIAAIFVVLFHTSAFLKPYLVHSYLAVDLFFILSGFVIAHAYDNRLTSGEISFAKFIRFRLTRLYPIYILSVIVSVPLLLLGLLHDVPESFADPSLLQIATVIISTAFFLPFYSPGVFALFPLNQPYWSLLFELIANFSYAFVRPLLNDRLLSIITILSGFLLLMVVKYFGKLNVGASWDFIGIIGGFARCIFGFFCGLILYRHHNKFGRYFSNSVASWAAVLIIGLVLSAPSFSNYNGIFDLISALIVFPISVVVASHGKANKMTEGLILLGTASYPLYVFHSPLSQMLSYWTSGLPLKWATLADLLILIMFLIGGLWLDRYYDVPVRNWLSSIGKNRNRGSKICC